MKNLTKINQFFKPIQPSQNSGTQVQAEITDKLSMAKVETENSPVISQSDCRDDINPPIVNTNPDQARISLEHQLCVDINPHNQSESQI